jgi:hypothetical protein
LLDISLFARAKILIVFAIAILAACGVEALERLASDSPARTLALRIVPFAIAVPLAMLAFDFYPECRPEQAVFRDTPGIVRLREAAGRGERFAAAGWTLIPNVSEALGLDDVRGHFLLDAGYRRLVTAADPNAYGPYGTYLVFDPWSLDPASPVLDLLGVRWLAAPPGASSPVGAEAETRDAAPFQAEGNAPARSKPGGPSLARVYAGRDLSLFERPHPFPRFFTVGEARAGGVEGARRADRETLARAVFVSAADGTGSPGRRAPRGDGGSGNSRELLGVAVRATPDSSSAREALPPIGARTSTAARWRAHRRRPFPGRGRSRRAAHGGGRFVLRLELLPPRRRPLAFCSDVARRSQ